MHADPTLIPERPTPRAAPMRPSAPTVVVVVALVLPLLVAIGTFAVAARASATVLVAGAVIGAGMGVLAGRSVVRAVHLDRARRTH